MTSKGLLCWLVLAAAAPEARAEQVYVVEQLVVAVLSEPAGAGERVSQVKSGDRLEVIERQGDEAHVRLANGKDGWLKSSYLSAEEPLTLRLSERTAEADGLKQDVSRLKQDVSRLESELAGARSAAAAAPANTAAAAGADPVSEAQPEHEAVFWRSPEQSGETPWGWVLGTAVVMLFVGFAIGWRTLDRRIRRKYGGLRIY
jgi:hypothetical protein